MTEFISQIGVDWRLLLSQAVNFLLLIALLRFFAYKPIVNLLRERKERIEKGMAQSEEAGRRLGEVNELAREKLKEAEGKAMEMIREGEGRAKEREAELFEKAQKKEEAMIQAAVISAQAKKEETERIVRQEAAAVIKMAITKTVEMDPSHIDEALIKKAVETVASQ